MLLTIRVTIAIFFGSLVLWSQTLNENLGTLSPAGAEAKPVKTVSATLLVNQKVPLSPGQFTLNMNLSQFSPAFGNLGSTTPSVFSSETQAAPSQTPPSQPKAFSYGDAYWTRHKIHKYASIATLPLFISEVVVGQKLVNETGTNNSLGSAHSALAAGIGVLFGVNSVTGIWNMWDARKDPNGHRKRTIHGILMLVADAGFVATAASAPKRENNAQGVRINGDPSTHRAIALTSIGVATVGYVYMLFAR